MSIISVTENLSKFFIIAVLTSILFDQYPGKNYALLLELVICSHLPSLNGHVLKTHKDFLSFKFYSIQPTGSYINVLGDTATGDLKY